MTQKLTFLMLMLLSPLAVGWSHVPKRAFSGSIDREAEVITGPKNRSSVPYVDSPSPKFHVDSPRKGSKIIGGTEVAPNSLPFLVLVVKRTEYGFDHWCGGSVLDSTHILSAAHCFRDLDPSLYKITAGEHNYTDILGNEQVRDVSKITRYPKYDYATYPNDVAVLTLSAPLTLGNEVKAVDLNADTKCPVTGATCTVAGWGRTESGSTSVVPLKVDVPVQSGWECSLVYLEYGEDQICVGAEGIDSCQGDSGGPLVCQCGGSLKQVGVVSYGIGCGVKYYPGVYAKVSYFNDWIKQTAGLQ